MSPNKKQAQCDAEALSWFPVPTASVDSKFGALLWSVDKIGGKRLNDATNLQMDA